MKKRLPGHLVGFDEWEEMLDYDKEYFANGAMSERVIDYHSDWENEFQEEIFRKVLEEDSNENND
ncbi:hypothetical protein [Virgibacillus sp. DJP39]|uniref:hypothetical protein n=1 Tax=Virgibacillus sp. DJP39 TaxID=3409790 RepID=UPI003BB68F06